MTGNKPGQKTYVVMLANSRIPASDADFGVAAGQTSIDKIRANREQQVGKTLQPVIERLGKRSKLAVDGLPQPEKMFATARVSSAQDTAIRLQAFPLFRIAFVAGPAEFLYDELVEGNVGEVYEANEIRFRVQSESQPGDAAILDSDLDQCIHGILMFIFSSFFVLLIVEH